MIYATDIFKGLSHDSIMDLLLRVFNRDFDELLLDAIADNSKKRYVEIPLLYEVIEKGTDTPFTVYLGSACYSKKNNKFTHINYADAKNYAVQFSITSRVEFSAYEHHLRIKHIYPFGCSNKRLKEYLDGKMYLSKSRLN